MINRWMAGLPFQKALFFCRMYLKHGPIRSCIILQVILDAKSDEFVNVFQESTDEEKRRVMLILNQIDPTHVDKYRKITAGK